MRKYTPTGPGRTTYIAGDHVVIARDVIDDRGDIWRNGAQHVEGPNVNARRKGSKGRPFIGETAWSDAQRLADDLYWQTRTETR